MALTKKRLQKATTTMREELKRQADILNTLDDLSQDPHSNQGSIENWLHAILYSNENTEDTIAELVGGKGD